MHSESAFTENDIELLEKVLAENPLALNDDEQEVIACYIRRSSKIDDTYDMVGSVIHVAEGRKAAIHCGHNNMLYVLAFKSKSLKPNHSQNDMIKWLNTEEGRKAKEQIHGIINELLVEEAHE